MIFKKIKRMWQSLRLYVIADPADNSITLSKHLFKHITEHACSDDAAKVFVFEIAGEHTYGFMVNPELPEPSVLCDIQHNDELKCIGFETLCPSVGLIFHTYGLPAGKRMKLSVSTVDVKGKICYKIDRPNAKHIRKHTKA